MRSGSTQVLLRGMTLIEVMVALVLLSLLSVGMITSFRLAERTYRQLTHVDASTRAIARAQRFLRQVLETAYPLEVSPEAPRGAFGLVGAADRLLVTASMPQSAGDAGHYRYEILEERVREGFVNLVVRWCPDRSGGDITVACSSVGEAHEEILIQGIQSVEWGYLGRMESADGQSPLTSRWASKWSGRRRLPALVRLRVTFPPDDGRRWPELIVAPRITDNANCQFDTVSQDCREERS
jgi:general secretion pathway protein J